MPETDIYYFDAEDSRDRVKIVWPRESKKESGPSLHDGIVCLVGLAMICGTCLVAFVAWVAGFVLLHR